MPIQKFRSIEEVPPPPAPEPGSAEHLRRWKALWDRAHALSPKRFRRGVVRYRSIEDAWADDFGEYRTATDTPAPAEASNAVPRE